MNAVVMRPSSALQDLLGRISVEIRLRRAESGAWRGAFWGSLIAVLIYAVRGALGDSAPLLALLTMGIAMFIGAAAGAARRIAPLVPARLADQAFGLHDRLATALERSQGRSASVAALDAVLLADAARHAEKVQAQPRVRVVPRHLPREARLVVLPLLAVAVLAQLPPLHAPASLLQGLITKKGDDERTTASIVDRLKLLGDELLRRAPAPPQEAEQRAAEEAKSAASETSQFKDRALGKRDMDFASFMKNGDDRLKVLEHSDKLPDLQSDFASSNYRALMKKSQELTSGSGAGKLSQAKLGQILREMERLGKKSGDDGFNEEVRNAMQDLDEGRMDEAMEGMQDALGKLRKSEEQQRASKMLRGGPDGKGGERYLERGENGEPGQDKMERPGYGEASKGSNSTGSPTARLRSTPYDAGIQGSRRGRNPGVDTQMTSRPGAAGAQLQYLGEVGQYRRLMEDAITREQIPRDYHNQIRDYFKSLQEQ